MNRLSLLGVGVFCLGIFVGAKAHSSALEGEIKRFQGHWKITEMVENGRVVPPTQMRQGLPGGGRLEIVDYTILFKSPVDGSKSTKSFRLDPTVYPKEIAVIERDKVTGIGIYQLDKGKLIICIAIPSVPVPTEFSAHENSSRTMMVMEPYTPSEDETAQISLPSPPTNFPRPPAQVPNPPTPPSQSGVAGRVLTDAEVNRMLVGNWRLNDGEGLVDISFNANHTFSTFRHTQSMSNFHSVFVPTPVSSGNWNVLNGQLTLNISSSWRADRVNTKATFAVRSISTADAIIVDSLGRVTKAARRP